jgi:hypothetical protein
MVKKIIISSQSYIITFLHLQTKFQKFMMKIDIVEICPNIQLSPRGTLVL